MLSSRPRNPVLLIVTLGLLSTQPLLAAAQIANLPDPDNRCTMGLCRPIGEIMASCIGGSATPENISWDDLMSGGNINVDSPSGQEVEIPRRLQCFCSSPGLERRLQNCNGCYVATNQEEYWSTGINNIMQVCGFTEPSKAPIVSSKKAKAAAVGVAIGVGLSLAMGDGFGISA